MMGTYQPVLLPHSPHHREKVSKWYCRSLFSSQITFSTIEGLLKDSDVLMKCRKKILSGGGQFCPGLARPWACHHDGVIAIKLGLRYSDHKDVPELCYLEMFTFMISIKNILQSSSSKITAVLKDLLEFLEIFCFSHLIKPIRTMFIFTDLRFSSKYLLLIGKKKSI